MLWHYADGTERKGPIEETELLRLLATSKISTSTLVWKSGFTSWVPLGETTLNTAGTVAAGNHRCIITGKVFAEAEMIQTAHGWVSAEGKDTYYQALREGVSPTTVGSAISAWRDGNRIVVPIDNPRLPARCVKTNAMVAANDFVTKKLYWEQPLVYLSILISILITLILVLALRKKLVLEIPLSAEGRAKIRTNAVLSIVGFLAGVALIIWPIAASNDALLWLIAVGVVAVIGSLVFGSRKATALRVTRMRDGKAWVAGASPEFLASLPPFNG